MRILNIDGLYFVRAFQEMGHEVLTVGEGLGYDLPLGEVASLRRLMEFMDSKGFKPDLVLWCDRCRPPSVVGFEGLPVPSIGFSIDQYCNPWHVPFSAAFDVILVAQKDYVPMFKHARLTRQYEWFPLFCDKSVDVDPGVERDIPVSFVGTLSGSINTGRMAFLNRFKAKHPVFLHQGVYPPIFGRSRIVVNQSAAGEINFRTFQAAACGAAVLTEDISNGQPEIFTPGVNLLVYPRGNPEAAAHVARKALEHPEDLADLARAGRDLVLTEHSDAARARTVMRHATKLLDSRAWTWRVDNRTIVNEELSKAYAMLGTDEVLPVPPAFREQYLRMSQMYMSAG